MVNGQLLLATANREDGFFILSTISQAGDNLATYSKIPHTETARTKPKSPIYYMLLAKERHEQKRRRNPSSNG
jgi:hypothetical protein